VPIGGFTLLVWLHLRLFAGLDAAAQPAWRFWTVREGLVESYTLSLGASPDGTVWARHGAVGFLSQLDGYSVRQIPEPRLGKEVHWQMTARVYGGPLGDAWTVEDGSLKQYWNQRWLVRARSPPDESMIAAIPMGPRRIWVLFSSKLAQFDAETNLWTILKESSGTLLGSFSGLAPGFGRDVWVTGENGAGRLELSGRWTECDTRAIGLKRIQYPHPAQTGELLFSGVSISDGSNGVARWHGPRVEFLWKSNQQIQAWSGPEGDMWVLEGPSLRRMAAGRTERIARRGPLSGVVYDVLTQPGGIFWIASSDGIARYAPPLWRTPAPVSALDEPVYSIAEDWGGRIWFAASEHLVSFDGKTWRIQPLPRNYRMHPLHTDYLTALPGGRIAMKVLDGANADRLLAFDPESGAFETVSHPDGRRIDLAWRRRDGTLWVEVRNPCQLEIYDGHEFRPHTRLQPESLCGQNRYLMEASDGSLWLGTTALGGRILRQKKLEAFGPAQGYPEPTVFAIFEPAPGRMLVAGRDSLSEFDGKRWVVRRTGLDRPRSMAKSRDGSLWLASASGISRLKNGSWITNGEEEGLPSDTTFKIMQDSRGRVWPGTNRGISLYHPDADVDAPRTWIGAGNPHQASPDGNAKIVFTGMDKWRGTLSDRLMYSYRLDDGAWSPFASSNEVFLERLPHGTHRLEARAMDLNGNAGPPSPPFALRVLLPWYEQNGFLAIVAACLTAILTLLYLARSQYCDLKQAKLAAEAANRSKSKFLANMSHELRTPMNAIMGMAALATELAVDARQQEYLTTVEKSSESLLCVLNDILDLSKVEAGKFELAPVDFDLRQCVTGVASLLRLRTEEKNLGLSCDVSPETPTFMYGDDQRLRQVLLNLVGNAIKFTERGSVSIHVRPLSVATEGATLEFCVADTGIGIPPNKQDLIFAPFEQADGSATRRYGGTGLGLAISSRLVGLMQGRIWVESPWHQPQTGEVISGSAFYFTARFRPGKPPHPEPRQAAPASVGSLRILVVEDNPVNQKLALCLLEKFGHQTLVASDGQDALTVLEVESVDLILMDVQMPRLDGLEATAAIRRREKARGGHIPIIGVTAHALRDDRDKCLQAGMDAYLAKPIRRDELARAIADVMTRGRVPEV
jgi:signal transduction histidine kinase/ActR/RegA family two-component response regulator